MNPVSVSYRYIGMISVTVWEIWGYRYRFEYYSNRYRYIGIVISVSVDLYNTT